ncbi:MAG: hypothetical protein FLDDKLPJ_03796 [Phycisphaerae bacterium]|nr:hypothetical protein [Phycisphaerae bacterium]
MARFDYAFDAAGNRLSNAGHRGSGGNAEGFSKIQNIDAYQHDGLHRLTKVDYNRSATTGDEVYVYDSLGNRVTYTDQRNATTRTYANNVANEYTSVAAYAVTHDAAGNLSKQVVNGDGDSYQYTYDCDNRLLAVAFDEVGVGTTDLASFAYDALGRKITAWTQFDGTGDSQTADGLLAQGVQLEPELRHFSIIFVERHKPKPHAVSHGAFQLIQCDAPLGAMHNVVRNAGLAAPRPIVIPILRHKQLAIQQRVKVAGRITQVNRGHAVLQLATALQYCFWTQAVRSPFLTQVVSSMIPTLCGCRGEELVGPCRRATRC